MRFLIDAQLPRRIVRRLVAAGHDAIHTLDLPLQNKTPDAIILDVAAMEQRVVVTKDADFVNSFHISGRPDRLLLISTGNISNSDLERLLLPLLPEITATLETHRFVELTRSVLIVHL